MNRITALMKLTRIEHSAMLVIAVIAAEIIAGYIPAYGIFALSLVTPIFISMGSFAINDYYDVESDTANKRTDRPIVGGAISRKTAMYIAVLCFIIGVLASAFINIAAFAIALMFAVLAILYSYKLKDMLLIGNVYIAFSMVIPFIYGSYVVAESISTNILLICMVIFLAGLGREIHGMVRDYSGDSKARNSKNLVSRIGSKRASQYAFILYIEAILISIYMFFLYQPFAYNVVYMIPIAITDAMLVYVSIMSLSKKANNRFFRLSRNISLAAMGIALIAFLISAVFYVGI